jgi:hypothetical protein
MQVDGQTALHVAAGNGHRDIVEALLAAGATVSATTTVRGLVSRVRVGSQRTRCIGPAVGPWRTVALRGDIAFRRDPPTPLLSLRLLSAVPRCITISDAAVCL